MFWLTHLNFGFIGFRQKDFAGTDREMEEGYLPGKITKD